jgi:hypothetical protein
MLDLTDLHDASLDSLAIDVDAGTVTLVLSPAQFHCAKKSVTIVACLTAAAADERRG